MNGLEKLAKSVKGYYRPDKDRRVTIPIGSSLGLATASALAMGAAAHRLSQDERISDKIFHGKIAEEEGEKLVRKYENSAGRYGTAAAAMGLLSVPALGYGLYRMFRGYHDYGKTNKH